MKNAETVMRDLLGKKACDSFALTVFQGGKYDRLTSENVNADTLFDVASSGKVLVTSTLILHAIGKKMISLDDTLDSFFSNVPEEKKKITVRQLLTHTSGIIRYPLSEKEANTDHDGIAAWILSKPLAFLPGTEYRYSCNGFILLGFILEKAYKKPLDRIYREEIVIPLGMTRTTFVLPEGETNRAISHRRDSDGKFPADDENLYEMRECAGSGGQFFSVADAEKLLKAIYDRDPRLFPKELFDLSEKDFNPDFSEGRGLGYWYVDDRYSPNDPLLSVGSFGHWGSTGTCFYIDRQKDLFVILFTNLRRGLTRHYGLTYAEYSAEFTRIRRQIFDAVSKDIDGERTTEAQAD